jgi:hypothetical protein
MACCVRRLNSEDLPTLGRPVTRGTGTGMDVAFVSCVGVGIAVRGLHSFPFQLNLSYSVHRITQLNS